MQNIQTMQGVAAPNLPRYRRRPAAQPGAQAMPKITAPARTRGQTQTRRAGMTLNLSSVLCFVLFVALAMFIVYNYMQLSEYTRENAALTASIKAIKQENLQLQNKAHEQISLKELEDIARNRLQMIKPTHENIVYIDLSGPERAVVIQQPSLWESIQGVLGTMAVWMGGLFS